MARAPFKNAPLLTPQELQSRLGELDKAIEEFNDGYWFESHETLEDLWMVTPLPERTFMQGIIQAAAAFVHLARREYPGTLKLLDLSIEKLRVFVPEQFGVDVARLAGDLQAARDELAALGEKRFLEWDYGRAPKIHRVAGGGRRGRRR
ncbi:MAG TPA: DUF309 domain-containing protein [Dehalococcoidia bacterium]|nr:DUF309 domain-containing protein [Dehalococcoidia bacterium]